ncbi:HAD family hydrolase [Echinicola vietnamensis]|uniref:Haloacid dehalogenase superfamily protein, subfamily IA, variant 3 with third motif having DD or ED n=1 Tax=Echinicola vietnamensis (strain DSM 17526 / LMG 23754 / KMM 6221) TaxID=926556 RepID=L0FZL4_ECHVK|nr:HAD family phosphatase [Echinicola vietnamensis]AGA78478.1 haloacid dehalogenase superfamily protein, subfamily IA, variant 3 with third motif having DD or ED [Echinicola vietnamensis DSM 17526]
MSNKDLTFIFDMNGTMIDDMHFHTKAWHQLFNEDLGANLSWEEVKVEMYGKNPEVLDRVFGKGHFTPQEAEEWSMKKEKRYQEEYRPHLALIKGLDEFLEKANDAGIKMAVGTAAIPFNVDFALDNLDIRKYFSAIVTADDVKLSKPHPDTFTMAAEKLKREPEDCIVFEDAPKGVEAAQNAGMKAVVITTAHPKEDFQQYDNVLAFIEDYDDPFIKELI